MCSPHGCMCAPGIEGDACEIDAAQAQCPGNCSAWGTCVRGQCRCFAGRTGPDCAHVVTVECASDCFGRGLCHNGHCYCHRGYTGLDCAVPVSSLLSVAADSIAASAASSEQSSSGQSSLQWAMSAAGAHVHKHLRNSASLIVAGVAVAAFIGGTLTSVWWLRRTSMFH